MSHDATTWHKPHWLTGDDGLVRVGPGPGGSEEHTCPSHAAVAGERGRHDHDRHEHDRHEHDRHEGRTIRGRRRYGRGADHWIHGRDGIRIAIGHQAAMGRHAIGTGLMTSERRRLIEWAEQAIAPEFVPVPKLESSSYARPPKKQLKTLPPLPKNKEKKDPGDLVVILDKRELNGAHNAQVLRARLAEALDGEDLTAVVLHQSDAIRDQMIAAAETGLGLAGHRCVQGPMHGWEAEELTVRMIAARVAFPTSHP